MLTNEKTISFSINRSMIADKVILLDEGSLKKAGTPDALCEEISGSVFERRVGFDEKNDLMVNPGLEDVYLYYFGI